MPSRVDDVCAFEVEGRTKVRRRKLILLSPMPFDAIDFNGSKFWHFCDTKEIEIWKKPEKYVWGESFCSVWGEDIVVNIIKTIHNNHKFFVERMKKKEEKATNIKMPRNGKIYQFNQELLFSFSLRRTSELTSETFTLI